MAINLYDAEGKPHAYTLTCIKYELQPNGVALCTLNTPKNLNALTLAQQWEMFAILDHATRDDQVTLALTRTFYFPSFLARVGDLMILLCYAFDSFQEIYRICQQQFVTCCT